VVGRGLKTSIGTVDQLALLWFASPLHGSWPVQLMKTSVVPAVAHQSNLVFSEGPRLVGYISWACLTEENEAKYIANPHQLLLRDWVGGDRLWFIDLIAPYGHLGQMVRHLKTHRFPTQTGRFMRVKKGNDTAKVVKVHGAQLSKENQIRHQPINPYLISKHL